MQFLLVLAEVYREETSGEVETEVICENPTVTDCKDKKLFAACKKRIMGH